MITLITLVTLGMEIPAQGCDSIPRASPKLPCDNPNNPNIPNLNPYPDNPCNSPNDPNSPNGSNNLLRPSGPYVLARP